MTANQLDLQSEREASETLLQIIRNYSDSDGFDRKLLEFLLESIAGKAALLWDNSQGYFYPALAVNCDASPFEAAAKQPDYQEFIEQVFQSGAPRAFSPLVEKDGVESEQKKSGYQILAPLPDSQKTHRLVHLFVTEANESQINLLQGRIGRLAAVLHCRSETETLAKLQGELATGRTREKLLNAISHSIDRLETAYIAVNELAEYLDCDRVSFVESWGDKARVVAVSGQATFDKRSNVIRSLESLAKQSISQRQEFWSDDASEGRNGNLSAIWDKYQAESHVCSGAVIPVSIRIEAVNPSDSQLLAQMVNPESSMTSEVIGAIVLEKVNRSIDQQEVLGKWGDVAASVTNALKNAREHHSLFLMPVWKGVGRFTNLYRGKTRKQAVLVSSLIAIIMLGLLIIPSDFNIRCEGVIQPQQQFPVFARQSGRVVSVHVQDGDVVTKGDLLLLQQNPDTQKELIELEGRANILQDKLDQLIYRRSQRLLASRDREDGEDLESESISIETELEFVKRQRDILAGQVDELSVYAPFDGVVYAWDASRRLLDRPLDTGVRLFTIAAESSDWEVQLRVPDVRAGYVHEAWNANQSLPVSYILSSAPGRVQQGTINHVAPNLDHDSEDGAVLPVTGKIDSLDGQDFGSRPRPGTSVVGKINCGRRSIAFCKSYEFVDWFRRMYFSFVH